MTVSILLQTSLGLLLCLEKNRVIEEDNLSVLEEVFTKVIPSLGKKIENYKREEGE